MTASAYQSARKIFQLKVVDGPLGSSAMVAGERLFYIRALGKRCIDAGPRRDGFLAIQTCSDGITQQFRVIEIDGTHDFRLQVPSTGLCVAIDGPTGPALAPGQRLVQRPCAATKTPAQRFAFDGDALMVGRQSLGTDRVSRELVIEPQDGITNAGTPVVVGDRDVNDAEYWRMIAVDGSNAKPHTGFRAIHNEAELAFEIAGSTWGEVLELEPGPATTIDINLLPLNELVLHEGATLRGGRKFMEGGAGIDLRDTGLPSEGFFLKLEDHTRVTALTLEGNSKNQKNEPVIWGLLIGGYPEAKPPELRTNVIVDHIDISRWGGAAINVNGPAVQADVEQTAVDELNECPVEPDRRLAAKLIGNFIHHGYPNYGVLIAQGGTALFAENLIFSHAHDVTTTFSGYNRYVMRDGLFTSEFADEDQLDKKTILDVHGACSRDPGSHWVGGTAGGFFDVSSSAFLTRRSPLLGIRGTPCEHFELHDNVGLEFDNPGNLGVETEPYDAAAAAKCNFEPGDPADILWNHGNVDIDNPLSACPRWFHGQATFGCGTGDLAVVDFDGDGRDDVFFGTGVSWWYSAGGKAPWRFLNRKPELASDLRFGDFDDDGRTDVIAMHGTELEVSWAGTSEWEHLNTNQGNYTIDDIAVGQFDHDPRADLFRASGQKWTWSSGGTAPWDEFATSVYPLRDLRFRDFDNDGITDVFGIENDRWKVVPGPGHGWTDLGAPQSYDMDNMVVADFDGDGKADVGLHVAGLDQWQWARGGTDGFQKLRDDYEPLAALPIGNFDDVPGDDVIFWKQSNRMWFMIASGGKGEVVWSTQSMK